MPAGELQDNPFCSRTSRPLLQCHTGSKIQFNITCAVKKPVQVFCTRLKFVQRQEMTGRCFTVPVGQRRAKFRQLNLYRKLLSKVILTLGKVPKKNGFILRNIPKSLNPPSHPRVFVRFGNTKGDIRLN